MSFPPETLMAHLEGQCRSFIVAMMPFVIALKQAYQADIADGESTAELLIRRYRELEPHRKTIEEILSVLWDYNDQLNGIKAVFMERSQRTKINSFSTDAGVAYKQGGFTVKVVDADAWLDYCLDHEEDGYLQIKPPSVETMRNYLQSVAEDEKLKGKPPPGLKFDPWTHINIKGPS